VSSSIDADGSYQIAKSPPGEVKISVMGPLSQKGKVLPNNLDWEKIKARNPGIVIDEASKRKMGFAPAPPPSPSAAVSGALPKKYSDPLQSGLTYTVTSGSQTYDIKLD
jgi:hypothetical protein